MLASTDHTADGRISLAEWRTGLARLAGDETSRRMQATCSIPEKLMLATSVILT
jgi:hypothetical protein